MCLTYESALSTLAPFVTQFCSTKQLLQSYVTTPLKNKSSNQKNFSFKFSEFKRSLRLVIKMLITLPKCQLPLNVFELPEVRFKALVNRILITKIECFYAFAMQNDCLSRSGIYCKCFDVSPHFWQVVLAVAHFIFSFLHIPRRSLPLIVEQLCHVA